MTLRARLTLAFALFAAAPMLAASWPVGRALSRALEEEYAARLDGAARAVESELAQASGEAAEAARAVAGSGDVESLARERAQGLADPAEAAGRAAGWMAARGLDVLALSTAEGEVISSGHLPGRAGDLDPELLALFEAASAGRPVALEVARATADGVEPALALLAWAPVPGDDSLRVIAGIALDADFARRLSALTGGEVAVVSASGRAASAPAAAPDDPGALARAAARLLGLARSRTRAVPLGEADASGRVEITLPASGLARAGATAALAFLAALVAAAAAAAVAGHLLARRITGPVEALRTGALAVAAGDLDARVTARATGELGELVAAFNRMTADLAQVTARAAAAERIAAWREVARRLAHEVKNPLTPIAMSVETLRDARARGGPQLDEVFDESTRAIRDEVVRLKRIVDEFSRFARLPAPDLAQVDPAELVDGVLALYPAPPRGVALERSVAPGLPPVSADRDQLAQVLLNLLQNALAAVAPRGGRVTVGARREGDEVLFTVADDGPGIAPEHLPQLFEPYFTTKEGGTGLGLAIAQRIATEHGGRVEVASRAGHGSTFTVRLPAAATGRASPSARSSLP